MGIGARILSLAGLERKTELSLVDAKDARIWGRIFGYGDSASGKSVTVDSALQLSAVWACVRLTAETVGTLPLMVYRRHADGGREVAGEHPLYGLLHDQPNADQTSVEFWEGVVLSLLLNGNAFAEKVRRSDGAIVALLPMAFDRTSIHRRQDGGLEYRFSDRGRTRVLGEDDVFHVRGFGNGGDLGLSPLAYARQTIGIATAADEAAGKMYANGIRPSGVLQMDQILKPDQRKDVRENIVGPLAGSSNAGGVFVLEGGMKFSAVSLSPKDAEMATARRWHVEEICRWFGMPPILIGHASEGQTMWGTGVGQIKQGWYTLGLRPLLRRIEAAIQRSLILPQDRGALSAEFTVEGFLRADSEARFSLYATAVQNGIRTRNEIRELENLPRIEGGDDLTVQSNLTPLQTLGQAPEPPPPTLGSQPTQIEEGSQP